MEGDLAQAEAEGRRGSACLWVPGEREGEGEGEQTGAVKNAALGIWLNRASETHSPRGWTEVLCVCVCVCVCVVSRCDDLSLF